MTFARMCCRVRVLKSPRALWLCVIAVYTSALCVPMLSSGCTDESPIDAESETPPSDSPPLPPSAVLQAYIVPEPANPISQPVVVLCRFKPERWAKVDGRLKDVTKAEEEHYRRIRRHTFRQYMLWGDHDVVLACLARIGPGVQEMGTPRLYEDLWAMNPSSKELPDPAFAALDLVKDHISTTGPAARNLIYVFLVLRVAPGDARILAHVAGMTRDPTQARIRWTEPGDELQAAVKEALSRASTSGESPWASVAVEPRFGKLAFDVSDTIGGPKRSQLVRTPVGVFAGRWKLNAGPGGVFLATNVGPIDRYEHGGYTHTPPRRAPVLLRFTPDRLITLPKERPE